jgi:hypothetical protein
MAITTVSLSVHVAWWVCPYIRALALVCWLTGMEPDMDKFGATVRRGFKVVVR